MKGEHKKMNITDVRIRKVAKEGKMKAVVSITIDDEFVVHDISVIETGNANLTCKNIDFIAKSFNIKPELLFNEKTACESRYV